jgi:hypothetical protein
MNKMKRGRDERKTHRIMEGKQVNGVRSKH